GLPGHGDERDLVDGLESRESIADCRGPEDGEPSHPAAGATVVEEAVDGMGQDLVAGLEVAKMVLETIPTRDELRRTGGSGGVGARLRLALRIGDQVALCVRFELAGLRGHDDITRHLSDEPCRARTGAGDRLHR